MSMREQPVQRIWLTKICPAPATPGMRRNSTEQQRADAGLRQSIRQFEKACRKALRLNTGMKKLLEVSAICLVVVFVAYQFRACSHEPSRILRLLTGDAKACQSDDGW